MKKLIIVGISMLLSGCSMHFSKPGSTGQDLAHDWTNCQAKAGQAGFPGDRGFLENCMAGEGWTRK